MVPLILAIAALPPLPVPVVPAPVIVSPIGNNRALLAWLPGEVRCSGAVVSAMPMRRPWTDLSWGTNTNVRSLTYTFVIDETGRTLDIRRLGGKDYVASSDDVAPSLAVTRFAAGMRHAACTVTYVPRLTALGTTPIADLLSYWVTPLSGVLPEEGWTRIRAGANCGDEPRPEPLAVVFPDYRALPGTPGVKDWALVSYDLDGQGRPTAVRVTNGSGNAALEAAAVKSMSRSRFTSGTARHGCLYPYARAATTLAPPPIPEEETARPVGATCPAKHEWSVMPTLRFPEPYRRRAIEGWAIVTYDVAPWGEVGNARVVASEPSEDFGTQALIVIRGAKVPTTQGLVGCVDRVRFTIPDHRAHAAAPLIQ